MTSKILLISLLVLATVVSAMPTCGLNAYDASCNECSFDATGKMDKNCRVGHENNGKGCLGIAYPMMSIKYGLGSCAQMDVCVDRLKACKSQVSTGSDLRDCKTPSMDSCFVMGDTCGAAANKVCAEGMTEEEAGFNSPEAGGPGFKPASDGEHEGISACGGPAMVMLFVLFGALFLSKQ